MVLDLCTGSGAIAISIKKYVDNVEITATDISNNALKVAIKNANLNNLEVKFIESNMFENINDRYDIIVSNPPYIEKEILRTLSKNVQYEPTLALDGGTDGLNFYREISKNSYKYLKKNGYLALEIGYNQKNSVIDILEKENRYKNIINIKDLSNNDRVIIGQVV
ncbi:MAG: peptide chain release factor N(5)-glutamine methyltransferase [Clostridia bacterium]|nr:peptide chain release factor N(5)-glutamine methyltransferase [Clostridia bacterium]